MGGVAREEEEEEEEEDDDDDEDDDGGFNDGDLDDEDESAREVVWLEASDDDDDDGEHGYDDGDDGFRLAGRTRRRGGFSSYPQRAVVIKVGTAAAAATILDAIDELRSGGGDDYDDFDEHDNGDDGDDDDERARRSMRRRKVAHQLNNNDNDLAHRLQSVDVVMVAVGLPVTPSDLAVASMAGATKIHTFTAGPPTPPSTPSSSSSSTSSAASSSSSAPRAVKEKSAQLGISLEAFETIQDLLDDVVFNGDQQQGHSTEDEKNFDGRLLEK